MGKDEPVVAAVSAQLPEISDDQVAAVLAAWNAVKSGEPVGTIVEDQSGSVAVRVSEDGVHMWRVSALDGGTWCDMQPTLPGWAYIRKIEAEDK